ncbi:hypothetical protein LguiB_027305 [Lonicera macranthoides]
MFILFLLETLSSKSLNCWEEAPQCTSCQHTHVRFNYDTGNYRVEKTQNQELELCIQQKY